MHWLRTQVLLARNVAVARAGYDEGMGYFCISCVSVKEGYDQIIGVSQYQSQFNFRKQFRVWIERILGMAHGRENENTESLLKEFRACMKSERNDAPSIEDCRLWLKRLPRSKKNSNC